MHLYERLADELAQAIHKGALRPGDRLPSVRALARQRGLSVATVVQALARLEDDGLAEAQDRSGYFVRARPVIALPEPTLPRPQSQAHRVFVSDGVRAVLDAMREPSVVPLGAAQVSPELLPIAQLNRTLAAIAREVGSAGSQYGSTAGVPTLQRQLAKRLVGAGVSLHASELIVTVGAMEALNLALRAVAAPGDTVAVESPTYFGVLQAIEALGLKAIEVPSHARSGLDLPALEATLRKGAKAVLAAPCVSNPLGAVMADADKQALVALCQRFDVPLIEDDVYGDLAFGARPRPAKAWDTDGRVLLLGSVSKTLAPGYRIGWIAPGRFFQRVEALKFAFTVATPVLLQMAVAELLATGGYERHVRRLKARLRAQVEQARETIARTFPPGTRASQPAGGFVLWVELPSGLDATELHRRALAHRIAVAPGPIFSASGRFGSHVRVSCGYPWTKRFDDALATVGRLAHELTAEAPPRRSRVA